MIEPPGNVAPPSAEWSATVERLIEDASNESLDGLSLDGREPPFFNPLKGPLGVTESTVKWSVLSGTLRSSGLSQEARWRVADQARIEPSEVAPGKRVFGQDEYCEWSVARSGDEVRSVTFTSEVGEWYQHLAADPGAIRAEYERLLGEQVSEGELFIDGKYNWRNEWNNGAKGTIVHLAQQNNNLTAAVQLAAEASVVRTGPAGIITDPQALMQCNGLGNADRFSDPSIAATINGLAAGGARIALANPPGLYLAGIRTDGMRLPPGHEDLDPADFWHPEKGENGRVVRARFEPPPGTLALSDVLLDGRPIVTGAQLAERVDVTISVLVHQAEQKPVTKPCG